MLLPRIEHDKVFGLLCCGGVRLQDPEKNGYNPLGACAKNLSYRVIAPHLVEMLFQDYIDSLFNFADRVGEKLEV